MKRNNLGYWIATGLLGAGFLMSGLMDLTHGGPIDQVMTHLGYPLHVATLLGIWKILGALAIVAPGVPRLKEWAYAGVAFDLSGAVWSHIAVGDGPSEWMAPVLLLAIAFTSWALRPADRKLTSTRATDVSVPATATPATLRAA